MAYGLITLTYLSQDSTNVEKNTYTSPDDVIPCAKPKVIPTVAGDQAKGT